MPEQAGRIGSIALGFQILPQRLDAHVECSLVDIDKVWYRPCLNDGLDGGDEGIRYGNDDIAITNISSHQSES